MAISKERKAELVKQFGKNEKTLELQKFKLLFLQKKSIT